MLAITPSQYMSPPSHDFLPRIPSPLSPRSANIYGRPRFAFMSDSGSEKRAQQSQDIPFAQRPVKKAPSPKQDELKERRRTMFLKKVREDRDEKRFAARGEDIMRLDFVQRQKEWEARLAREAPPLPADPPEAEEEGMEGGEGDLPGWGISMQISAPSTQQSGLEDEADEAMQRENEELEALLAYMPVEADEPWHTQSGESMDHLYSDDDDYDALFSELMEQDHFQQSTPVVSQQQGEAMDTS